MARSRNIKPGLYKNEYLVTISFAARYMAAGLPCWADREGRLEDRPLKLKMEMFPADNVDVNELLNELQDAGFINRYSVDNIPYIQIVKFEKHQSPHVNEIESTIPVPDEHGTCTEPEVKGISNKVKGISKEQEHKKENDFNTWYSEYPKKKSRKAALKAWMKTQVPPLDSLLTILQLQKQDPDWTKDDGKFVPYPSTYINQERWNDEITKPTRTETGFERNVRLANEYLTQNGSDGCLHGETVDMDGGALPPPVD